MPRIRSIKPDTFLDPDLSELGFAARYFFIGLWCQADREGRLYDEPRKLAVQILPFDYTAGKVDVEMLLSELSVKFIRRYEIGGKRYIQIINFCRHQKPNIKESRSQIPPERGKESIGTEKKARQSSKIKRKVKEGNAASTVIPSTAKRDDSIFQKFMNQIFRDYFDLKPDDSDQKAKDAISAAYRRFGRAGRDILAFADGDPQMAQRGIEAVGARMNRKGLDWNLDTVAKRFLEWKVDPDGYQKETTRS